MTETNTPAKIEKKRAINRLKSFYPFRELEQQSYLDTAQASIEGKPTVWAMANNWQGDIPLRAMGINIVYPENYSSLLAAKGVADRFLEIADTEGYPANLCGYARTTMGYAYSMMNELDGKIPPEAVFGGMPRPDLLLTSGMKCDTRFKWFQALGKYFDAPAWCLELPMMGNFEGTEADLEKYQVAFMVKEIRDYIVFIEKLFGKKMDWARLDKMIDLTVKIQVTMIKTAELCKAIPGPRHSIDFWGSFSPAVFTSPRIEYALKLYEDMLAEVQERVNNRVSAINYPERFRLVFGDLPPWHSMKFFDSLAERGWNFVFESYNYHQPPPPDMSKISDPAEKLARLSRNYYFHNLPIAKEHGTANYYVDNYLESARDYKIDGFFLHYLATCRPMSHHLRTLQEMLQRRMDVPSLWVEGDMLDRRVFDPQEVLARADAFEQTMEHYRQVRKDKGLDW